VAKLSLGFHFKDSSGGGRLACLDTLDLELGAGVDKIR